MKLTTMVAGLVLCSGAAAAPTSNPVLVGKTVHDSHIGGRIVICTYAEASVRYEIVSDSGNCTASLDLPRAAGEQRVATLQPAAPK